MTVGLAERHDARTTPALPIAAGDRVTIHIWDLEQPGEVAKLSRQVDARGEVNLPYLDKPVRLSGLTESAAADHIAGEYVRAKLFINPAIEVIRESAGTR